MKHLLTAARQTALHLPWRTLCRCAVSLLLTAAAPGGQYAPWSLAAVASSGVGWQGLMSCGCAGLGALLFLDFQPGLRHAASAILIFCANTALCTSPLYEKPRFRPTAAVCAAALTQFPYLVARGVHQWSLCAVSLTLLYGLTACAPSLSPDSPAGGEARRRALFLLLLGVCGALSPWTVLDFSPAGALTALLLLSFTAEQPVPQAVSGGALAGLVLDLCGGGTLYMTAVLCASAGGAACLRRYPRLLAAGTFCAAAVLSAWLLGESRPLPLLCQSLTASGVWLLLPAPPGRRLSTPPCPETAAPAAAFQAVYDSLDAEVPTLRPENPAVLFDRAAEQVCRDCPLRTDCWQTHYTDTYNAFNDACPRLLRRGKPLAEDFPAYFAARCVRFPRLLSALEEQLRGFLQRRASHARLDAAYRLAREQYAQVSQVLSACEPDDAPARPRYICRTALAARPKKGETLCGDEAACFAVGDKTYLLLSDGMGSGDDAHHEAAMTVRLLRQFLTAGVDPTPALKTLNTALMLRCQGGAGFTTIDLACMDGASGVVTLYKYGAAPSYLKKNGAVTRLEGDALPAGLESARRDPQPQRLTLSSGHWLVLASDGVTGEGDEWLQNLLAGWDGTSPRELAALILREAETRRRGDDDCAVLVLRAERLNDAKKRV